MPFYFGRGVTLEKVHKMHLKEGCCAPHVGICLTLFRLALAVDLGAVHQPHHQRAVLAEELCALGLPVGAADSEVSLASACRAALRASFTKQGLLHSPPTPWVQPQSVHAHTGPVQLLLPLGLAPAPGAHVGSPAHAPSPTPRSCLPMPGPSPPSPCAQELPGLLLSGVGMHACV